MEQYFQRCASEFHGWRRVKALAVVISNIKEIAMLEAHGRSKQKRRKRLDRSVILAHHIVEEAPRCGQSDRALERRCGTARNR